MCLTVSRLKENPTIPTTAKKPILVFKGLQIKDFKYITPYRGTEVVFNDGKCKMGDGTMDGDIVVGANAAKTNSWSDYNWINLPGFWENGKLKDSYRFKENEPRYVYIQKGIHAYFKRLWGQITDNYVFKPAIIPPGAHYFVGDSWDIVSDEMIVYLNDYERKKDYPDAKTTPWD